MKKFIYIFALLELFFYNINAQSVIDIDGNSYDTIHIGTQIWLNKDLKVTHFNNGSLIPNITNNTQWSTFTSSARCYYNNDSVNNASTYGVLYNGYTIINNNICPIGWHVPSEEEWNTLCDYLGCSIAGGKLKELGTTHWQSPNTGATNENGFTALPGGSRHYHSDFQSVDSIGSWWTSSILNPQGTTVIFSREMRYNSIVITGYLSDLKFGYHIRCLQNNSTLLNSIDYQNEINLYPNPTKDFIYISNKENKIEKLQVFNLTGECLLSNIASKEIDISLLSKGIYFIKIFGSDWTITRKIIKL
jgi:uncharacterized protein (TIGR02145 family)